MGYKLMIFVITDISYVFIFTISCHLKNILEKYYLPYIVICLNYLNSAGQKYIN